MRKRMTVAGVAVLGLCLAGWAAMALGEDSFAPPALAINGPGAPSPAAPAPDPTQLPNPDQLKPGGRPVAVPSPSPVGPVSPAPFLPSAAPARPGPTITPALAAPTVPVLSTAAPPPPLPAEVPVPPRPPVPSDAKSPASPPVGTPYPTGPLTPPVSPPAPPPPPLPQPPVVPTGAAAPAPVPTNPEVIPLSPRAPQPMPANTLPHQPVVPSQPVLPSLPVSATTQLKPTENKVEEPKQPGDLPLMPDTPLGRQEPAVSMEWIGPAVVKVGQPQDYTLALRNACNIPVQEVLVRVSLPAGMKVEVTEPKAEIENSVYIWRVGAMLPRQEKNMQMKLVADARGEVTPKAWVTFTGLSVLHVRVREPKLLLKTLTQEKVMVGDAAAFTLTVSNPGDGSADQVKIHALLSEGLDHGRDNKVDFEIGNLAAGETRSVQLICGTRVGGPQKCECTATADGGLTAQDTGILNVIMPRLDLQVVGPGLRYLDRKALYTLRVTNPGDAAATNVTVGDVVPAGFKVLAASDGGRHDYNTRTVSWFLGEIGPGQTREVKFEAQAIEPGEHKHKASAVGARGLKAESELTTRVEGLSAIMLELVDTEDPIEVGADTTYEVRITNTGSKAETDIKLVAVVPEKMEFKGAQGPVHYREDGKTIVFEPVEKLAPRADAFFKITCKAQQPGTVRFKIQVTSTNLVEPVTKEEPTRIYSDAPDVKP